MDVYKTEGQDKIMVEWRDHKMLVLHELQRMNENIEKLTDSFHSQKLELATIKAKATAFGTIAGLLVSLLAIALDWFHKH